eukprot:3702321-Pleurochrysis_carterae.AAC.1
MARGQVGIGMPVQRGARAQLVAKPDVLVVVQVRENAASCVEEARRWTSHGAAEHANRVGDV